MKLIDLIFALVARFVPMSPDDLRNLNGEANQWEQNIADEGGSALEKMYVKVNDPWYYRLSFAVSYIFLVKEIKRWFYDDEPASNVDEMMNI